MAAGQRIFKFSDGSLQGRECGAESLINGVAAAGPVGGDWIETVERAEDSGMEFYGSSAKGNEPLNRKSAKDGNKRNDHGDGPGWDDYFHAAILWFLPVAIPMIPVFMQKPNQLF